MNILPSYKCNMKCPFCIIHKMDQNTLLDLNWLENNIQDIPATQIDILGGEPSLLNNEYLERLIEICQNKIKNKKPGMYTNLLKISPNIDKVELTVSYDPKARQHNNIVLKNMLQLDKQFCINMIVTKYVIDMGAEKIINFAKRLKMLKQLTLSTYTLFPGCIDLKPDPGKFIQFCKDIINLDKDNIIRFYPISTWKEQYIKKMNPADVVEILPNKKFRIAIRDYSNVKEFNTYQEAKKFYIDNYNSVEQCCINCNYYRRCTYMYIKNNTCKYDKEISDAIISELKI